MSFVDTCSALEQRLKVGWTRTPISWENQRFDPPTDGAGNLQPYIAMHIRGGAAEDIVLGSDSPEWRWTGIVIVNIYGLPGAGMGLLRLYADLIKTIFLQPPRDFQYLNSGVIRLYVPQVIEIGTVNGWSQVNVITPFKRDARQ